MKGVREEQAAKQPHENPKHNIQQIIDGLTLLRKETDLILDAPPPKVEEPKKEEDAKMEGEEASKP